MIERIEELRAEGEAAIAAATGTAALEEARIAHLGRKAELPNLLRGVAQLPPEQRGAVGKAANQARQALEALVGRRHDALAAAVHHRPGPDLPARPDRRDALAAVPPGRGARRRHRRDARGSQGHAARLR